MQDYASKEHVVSALKKGVRLDGRGLLEYRPITMEVDCIRNAEGSCKLTCGDTILIAGVKMSIGTPYPDTPDSGVLVVNAELLPISNPEYEPGPPGIDSIELSRIIDRGIRESKAIDEKALCIAPGEMVWMANVDICPINTDGTLIDMGGLASLAALSSARLPKHEGKKVDYKSRSEKRLPMDSMPIPVTVVKIGDVLLLDPTHDEWRLVDARLTITTLEDGRICSLQKGGDAPLSIDEIEQMIDIAIEKGAELRKMVAEVVGK